MSISIKSLGIDRLSVDERLTLLEQIWDSIEADDAIVLLTDAQRTELDRRLADYEAHPDEVIAWDDVEAPIISCLGE